MKLLEDYIFIFISCILVLNILLYVYSSFKLKKEKALYLLTLYLISIGIIHFWQSYLHGLKQNNLFLFHTYLIIQFLGLSFFYKSIFNKSQRVFALIMIFAVPFVLGIYYMLIKEDFLYFNAPEILITTIPILAYMFMHFYNSLTAKGDYLILTSGLLVYLSISSLVWILYAFGVDDKNNDILDRATAKNISFINTVSYFLLQIIIFLEWKLNISKWKINRK